MNKIALIGFNIFRQLIRNRILVVLVFFAVALAWAVQIASRLGVEIETRMAMDLGLLAMEWVGFATVLLCHVVLLFEETELKTISMVLVKPIRRWEYMVGKLFGSVLLLAVNQLVLLALLVVLAWDGGYDVLTQPYLLAAGWLFLGGILFSLVCLLFSVVATTVPACATYSSFAFLIGHFTSNLVEWMQTMDSGAWLILAKLAYYIVPNFQLFNFKDDLHAGPQLLDGQVLGNPVVYLACYGGLLLLIALRIYERKEF